MDFFADFRLFSLALCYLATNEVAPNQAKSNIAFMVRPKVGLSTIKPNSSFFFFYSSAEREGLIKLPPEEMLKKVQERFRKEVLDTGIKISTIS